MTTTRSMSSVETFYTAQSSNSTDKLNSVINLNGKSYHLTVYYKESASAQEKDITQRYLKLAKKRDFQEMIQQAGVSPSKKMEIQVSIHPSTNSIRCDIQSENEKVKISLTKAQSIKILGILEKIRIPKSTSSLSKENLETLNSSFKMSLEETKTKRTHDYLRNPTNFNTSENYEQDNTKALNRKARLEDPNLSKPIAHERVMGLDRLGNNCCINAALQIILTNPNLRELWKQHFEEPADMYYKALNEGKSSAPEQVTQRFRELLAEKSRLVDKESTQQEASYVLEAFFNICQRDGLDLSSIMLSSKKAKYKVTDGIHELDRTNTNKAFLMPIIVDQSTSETRLEELIKKDCSSITEAGGNKFEYTTKYTDLPSSLIIHFSHYGKASLRSPMNFTFPKECIEDSSIHEYALEAFVVHLGKTHNSGHYIAFRKVNGQWKMFNDHVVTDVNENQIQQLLGNFQEEESAGFLWGLLRRSRSFLKDSNPYICMLSYSKSSLNKEKKPISASVTIPLEKTTADLKNLKPSKNIISPVNRSLIDDQDTKKNHLQDLKDKQANHLQKLQTFAQKGDWQHLHTHTRHPDSGFDWWMFPINRGSVGYGNQYVVNQEDIANLSADKEFMSNYRKGVVLVAKSWGWDLEKNLDVTSSEQKWTGYWVRLGKMLHSLQLFNQTDLHANLVGFLTQRNLIDQIPSKESWIKTILK